MKKQTLEASIKVASRARTGIRRSLALSLLATPSVWAESPSRTFDGAGQRLAIAAAEDARRHGSRYPLVRVEQGWLRGVGDEERAALDAGPDGPGGVPVDEFLGIAFAAPPLGELRFRPPAPAASWRGVRDARKISVLCAQAGAASAEDCLYLNVFRPRVHGKVPVLLYIHGGSLMVGSASEYRARKLASEIPAVVVTTNYRLNTFGFLSLPGSVSGAKPSQGQELSGNYGLRDQQAALAWVRRNIARFGGDPERITLAGHSSGAMSVCAHLASPPVRGEFAGAMIQSGPCAAVPRDVMDARGVAFASSVGCTDLETAADCLRALPTELVTGSFGGFAADFALDPELLPLAPLDAIASGQSSTVPTLLGATRDELRIYVSSLFPLAPERHAELLETDFPGLAAEVAARYPAADYPDPVYAYSAALSDSIASCSVRRDAALLSGTTTTYVYEFDDPNAPAPHWMPVPAGFVMGSTHSSDAPYIFDRPGLVQPDAPAFDAFQLALGEDVRQAIGAFLRTGDPSPPGGPMWPPHTSESEPVMLLKPGGLEVIDTYAERHQCDFWDAAQTP